MLYTIPIYAVKVEDLGERGAQYTALKLLQEVAREAAAAHRFKLFSNTGTLYTSARVQYCNISDARDPSGLN